MASHFRFSELVLIQEPGAGGDGFINSILDAVKAGEYKGEVRVLSLPVKDPRELWLSLKGKEQFTAKLEVLITETAPMVFTRQYHERPI